MRQIISVTHVRDCERMCATEPTFKCHTYSFRYSPVGRDNCLLCDRPYHHLDIYADLEPDRDFDIYSMSDDPKVCKQAFNRADQVTGGPKESNAQCFFRSIDSNRFYQSVVRDSMNVKSVGECKTKLISKYYMTILNKVIILYRRASVFTIREVYVSCLYVPLWTTSDRFRSRKLPAN